MYAVVKAGGRQIKVSHGQMVRIDKIDGEVGSPVRFEQVLVVGGGPILHIGAPALEGVVLEAEIVEHGKADKVLIFKKRRRKNYRRKRGFRAQYTLVRIKGLHGHPERWEAHEAPQA